MKPQDRTRTQDREKQLGDALHELCCAVGGYCNQFRYPGEYERTSWQELDAIKERALNILVFGKEQL